MTTTPILTIEQSDGSVWAVPVSIIARNRAAYYASEFDGDVDRSLAEDTNPLFEADDYEIKDWAANNMNWAEVAAHAFLFEPARTPDFQEAWVNGPKDIRSGKQVPVATGAGQ